MAKNVGRTLVVAKAYIVITKASIVIALKLKLWDYNNGAATDGVPLQTHRELLGRESVHDGATKVQH